MPVDVNWKGVRVASVNRLEAAFTRHSKVAIMFVAKKPGKHRNVPLLAVSEFPRVQPTNDQAMDPDGDIDGMP